MHAISEDPPDENEAYESWDEALDDEDIQTGHGPEGERELDAELFVDRVAVAEAGADLDDPERIAMLEGGMDDPDGSQDGGTRTSREEPGDPATREAADDITGLAVTEPEALGDAE